MMIIHTYVQFFIQMANFTQGDFQKGTAVELQLLLNYKIAKFYLKNKMTPHTEQLK